MRSRCRRPCTPAGRCALVPAHTCLSTLVAPAVYAHVLRLLLDPKAPTELHTYLGVGRLVHDVQLAQPLHALLVAGRLRRALVYGPVRQALWVHNPPRGYLKLRRPVLVGQMTLLGQKNPGGTPGLRTSAELWQLCASEIGAITSSGSSASSSKAESERSAV